MPLHTLLTDAVYSHGGTTELVQVMNRLGMISSEDTHAHYVDHVVHHSDNTHDIDLSDTVVTTLDNLDFLQSNALYIAEINIVAGMAQQCKSFSQSLQHNLQVRV